ncbi:hypothetical protein CHUAL_013816 [Chamberlinius hualienensis]
MKIPYKEYNSRKIISMGILLKYLSLGVLIVQTTSLVLILRYSRIASAKAGLQYLSSTAVVMVELFKVACCCVVVFWQTGLSPVEFCKTLKADMWDKKIEMLKMLVPSALYVIQNNLLYVALTHLDAATYQVTYQLKILTTAMFSVILLKKKLQTLQWISLIFLVIGVSLVQMPSPTPGKPWSPVSFTTPVLIGLVSVIIACFSSGFAGVYFEKILKNTQQSLWIRNIQLGFFGFFFALLGVAFNDFSRVMEGGFFQGYLSITWVVISLQAFGGILVAVVIKYADNILKSFAASLSIILSVVFSFYILGDVVTSRFFIPGTSVVLLATFLYSCTPKLSGPTMTANKV